MGNFIVIKENDNVGVALVEIQKGTRIQVKANKKTTKRTGNEPSGELTTEVITKERIPVGHKFAIQDIKKNGDIRKYGHPIGFAKEDIEQGRWVHTHNAGTKLDGALKYTHEEANKPTDEKRNEGFFYGFQRDNGDIGIRNDIWIINTVGCVNSLCANIAREANLMFSDRGIDGVYSFNHPYGCSQMGDDLANTQKVLKALTNHGNAAGVLVVGLGCENNHIGVFKEMLGEINEERVMFVEAQTSENEFDEALEKIEKLVVYAEKFKRVKLSQACLRIGLKCGGSDGLSGITANPLTGVIADKIISYGGTALMTEVPEIFGAETILMERAKDKETFEKLVGMINGFKEYFIANGQVVYENPSPGNKDGGITTLEDKSLGCTQKGGTSTVMGVLSYGEVCTQKGLNVVYGPGNDLVSVTALVAAGAHVVLFTTGRGTPYGGAVPTIKVSTNTRLQQRKPHWIDFNAGSLVEGGDMECLADEFFAYILEVVNGKKTNNERYGFKEIAIFKTGVTV